MVTNRTFLALAAAFLAAASASAQERVVRSEANAWLTGSADVWATPEWGAQAELLYERSDRGQDPMQVEARLGVQRALHSGARLAVGGTFVHNSPYGPFPARTTSHEYRLWEQATVDQRLGVVSLTHRYRLEQRWIEKPILDAAGATGRFDASYTMRARYQARATVPLTASTRAHPLYAAVAEEVFVGLGPHTPLNVLDQNRAFLGAGVRWSPALRTELGYLNQVILRGDGKQVEYNHTLQLSFALARAAARREAAPLGSR